MVRRVAIQFDVPEEFVTSLSDADLSRLLKRDLVLHLFREGRISAGGAADVLGLTHEGFRTVLTERGLPYFDLGPEELDRELAAGAKLGAATSGR